MSRNFQRRGASPVEVVLTVFLLAMAAVLVFLFVKALNRLPEAMMSVLAWAVPLLVVALLIVALANQVLELSKKVADITVRLNDVEASVRKLAARFAPQFGTLMCGLLTGMLTSLADGLCPGEGVTSAVLSACFGAAVAGGGWLWDMKDPVWLRWIGMLLMLVPLPMIGLWTYEAAQEGKIQATDGFAVAGLVLMVVGAVLIGVCVKRGNQDPVGG